MNVQEQQLRDMLRDRCRFPDLTLVFAEPAFGVAEGQPDCLMWLDAGWRTFELKRGRDPVACLRPSQRRWNKLSAMMGQRPHLLSIADSFILCGELDAMLCMHVRFTVPHEEFNYEFMTRMTDEGVVNFQTHKENRK